MFPVALVRNTSLLLLLSLIWGSSFLMVKAGVETITPLSLSAGRLLLGGFALGALVLIQRHTLPRERSVWRLIVFLGLVEFAIPFFLISWGTARIDSGLTAILIGTAPVFTVLLAHPINHDEPLTPGKLLGVVLGFTGIVVLVGFDALGGIGTQVWGQLAIVVAAVGYAVGLILSRRLSYLPPTVAAFCVTLSAAFWTLPLTLALDHPWALEPSAVSLLSVIALGVLPTALASIVLFRLLALTSASFAGLGNYLVPLIGVFLGAVVLAETIGWNEAVALSLILAAIAIVSRRPAAGERAAVPARRRP